MSICTCSASTGQQYLGIRHVHPGFATSLALFLCFLTRVWWVLSCNLEWVGMTVTIKIWGEKVYQQLKSLKEIEHPITGQKLTVLSRTADGKARLTGTGSSTACFAFPIPEAPEHIDQLSDMKLLFVQPTWSLEETGKARWKIQSISLVSKRCIEFFSQL